MRAREEAGGGSGEEGMDWIDKKGFTSSLDMSW